MRFAFVAASIALWIAHGGDARACSPKPPHMVFPGDGDRAPANLRALAWRAPQLYLGRVTPEAERPCKLGAAWSTVSFTTNVSRPNE